MNRKSLRDISVASLAVSVSAVALMGLPGVAHGDEDPYCLFDYPCTIDPHLIDPSNPTDRYLYGICGFSYEGYNPPDTCGCNAHIPFEPPPFNWVFSPLHPDCWIE